MQNQAIYGPSGCCELNRLTCMSKPNWPKSAKKSSKPFTGKESAALFARIQGQPDHPARMVSAA